MSEQLVLLVKHPLEDAVQKKEEEQKETIASTVLVLASPCPLYPFFALHIQWPRCVAV